MLRDKSAEMGYKLRMAKKKEAEQASATGERTAEEIHEARREAEREAQAASGMDRHGKRDNEDET